MAKVFATLVHVCVLCSVQAVPKYELDKHVLLKVATNHATFCTESVTFPFKMFQMINCFNAIDELYRKNDPAELIMVCHAFSPPPTRSQNK